MDKLFEKIEALQQKPLYVRKQILYISTGVLSALVFVFWLSIFPSTIESAKERTARIGSSTSPFAAFVGTVEEAGKSIYAVGDVFKEEVTYVREKNATASPAVLPKEQETASVPSSTTTQKEAEE